LPSENDFKKAFRASFGGWTSAVEPGRGSDTGAADLLVLVGQRIVPIELKLGHMHPDGRVTFHSPGIRPAQVQWHWSLAQAGGFSLLAAGEWDYRAKAWCSHFFWGENLADWRNGMVPIADCGMDRLSETVEGLVRNFGT